MACVAGLSAYTHFTGMLQGVVRSFSLGKFAIYFDKQQQLREK